MPSRKKKGKGRKPKATPKPTDGGANNDGGCRPSRQREPSTASQQQQTGLGWEQTMRDSFGALAIGPAEIECFHCSDPSLECLPDRVDNFFTEFKQKMYTSIYLCDSPSQNHHLSVWVEVMKLVPRDLYPGYQDRDAGQMYWWLVSSL